MDRWVNACDAYWWIYNHPKLQYKGCCAPSIEVAPHMVNPESKSVELFSFVTSVQEEVSKL